MVAREITHDPPSGLGQFSSLILPHDGEIVKTKTQQKKRREGCVLPKDFGKKSDCLCRETIAWCVDRPRLGMVRMGSIPSMMELLV